ncbi:uncharacterized protein LOC111411343 [Olea europaea var. sylvestris]|uniref:uncharacterized protein LOC111411343 n=1 Tax=Olea europaea var. sylvestris TaxID=158386 RepID=UPI000C1D3C4B|nr:uncharacterized protein LOC111411343 [Olea europaea var. sylvestris]
MDFEYLVPKNARLRAHISQRTIYGQEIWFKVQGHLARFGLQEYALVTGLMCGPLPDDAAMDRVLQKKRLKDKYFKSTERISCGELEKAFLRPSTPRADRYKLGLALIIEGVFNASDSHVGIELLTLSIVDDLDMFYSYPWGRVSYIRLIRGFRRRLGRKFVDATNKKEKAVTYTVHGFPIAMQIWAFEAILKIGDRFARRLGHQSPRLLSWTCTKQPQHWTYDAFFKNIKLHVSVTLHPTEAEFGQPCISTLMPFEDRTIPVLDEVARDIIPAQLHPDPLPSGGNVGNSRGECTMVFSGRGSEYDDESGDSEDEGAREATEGDKSGDSNGEASNEGDSGDSEDDHTRTPQTGTFLSPMHRHTSPFMHPPHLMYDKVKPLVRASQEMRWRNYCSIKERSSKFGCAQ